MNSSLRSNFDPILVAFDGSESATRACEVAAILAKAFGSEITVLHVIPSLSIFTAPLADEYYAHHQKEVKKLLEKVAPLFSREGLRVTEEALQAKASVVQTIVDYGAERKVNLIVVGSRGLGGFKGMLMGSVSNGVVAHSHCPVLVVK